MINRRTYRKKTLIPRKGLYYLLPVVFWLLAISIVVALPFVIQITNPELHITNYWWGLIAMLAALISVMRIDFIPRHGDSIEPCFQVAMLLGIASYWLPSLVILIIPIWLYLIYQQLFNFRSFLSSLIGFSIVAVWAAIFIVLGWISNPWLDFLSIENAYGWIPIGAVILAYIFSTIARRNLRER